METSKKKKAGEVSKKADSVKKTRGKSTTSKKSTTKSSTTLPVPKASSSKSKTAKRTFEYKRLSASMLKTWLQCKLKFHKHYIDGLPQLNTESFTLGTAVHYALEQANLSLMENPRVLSPFEIEDYLTIFRNKAAELYIENLDLFATGEEITRRELELANEDEKIIGVEKEFTLETPEGVTIYGFIDKLVEEDDTTIRVIDYKTSIMPMSWAEARNDEQMAMYDLAISILYPQYTTRILELRYVRQEDPNKVSVVCYKSKAEQVSFRKQIHAIHVAIQNYMKEVKKSKELPEGQLNTYCEWCSAKMACPLYKSLLTNRLPDIPSTLDLTDEEFIPTWDLIKATKNAVESWEDRLKIWALQRLEADPDNKIRDDSREVSAISQTRRHYDVTSLAKKIGLKDLIEGDHGNPLVSFSNKALENYVKRSGDRHLVDAVEQATEIRITSPSIKLVKRID